MRPKNSKWHKLFLFVHGTKDQEITVREYYERLERKKRMRKLMSTKNRIGDYMDAFNECVGMFTGLRKWMSTFEEDSYYNHRKPPRRRHTVKQARVHRKKPLVRLYSVDDVYLE